MVELSSSKISVVTIHSENIDTLRELVQTHDYDYGCRPFAVPDPRRGLALGALLTAEQLKTLLAEGFDVQTARASWSSAPPHRILA